QPVEIGLTGNELLVRGARLEFVEDLLVLGLERLRRRLAPLERLRDLHLQHAQTLDQLVRFPVFPDPLPCPLQCAVFLRLSEQTAELPGLLERVIEHARALPSRWQEIRTRPVRPSPDSQDPARFARG